MQSYIVLYRNNDIGFLEEPFGFQCYADDTDHAEEQCLNAEPDAEIVWVVEGTKDYSDALYNYYASGKQS